MIVLGIESTCDETACALVKDGREILANVVYSQTQLHKPFNGVFPELACRKHIDALLPVVKEALTEANLSPQDIQLISAAKGPGLIGALLIGLNAAKALSYGWGLPFIGVSHIEAHLYAAMMPYDLSTLPFPAIGLIISGGHTLLVKIDSLGSYTPIATTRDDAIGEAFDKVATLLGLPYPGGPEIEKWAKQGDPHRFAFKAGQVKTHPLDFSFSGLKTNVLYSIKGQNQTAGPLEISDQERADIAASFQHAALTDIVLKTYKAASLHGCNAVFCGGGVSNNIRLRELFQELTPLTLYYPPKNLSLDNAAMIAGLGFQLYHTKPQGDSLDLEPSTRIPL